MSKVVYNGIELGFIHTSSYRNEPVADKDHPDMIYRETTLQFNSVLAAGVVPAVGAETVQDVLIRVRHELELPRRSFLYQINGQTVISLTNGDDANGPFPFGVSVTLVADASFLIAWGIKIRTADCNGATKSILSHRWSESVSIDEKHLTTYRRSGRLVVSSRSGVSPDSFRSLVTPPIGPRFIRQSAEYTLHENGLELAFAFVDREQIEMPPYPAVKMTGFQMESTTTNTGAVRHGRLQIALTGPPGVPKQVLLRRCIELAMPRAIAAGLRAGPSGRYMMGGGIRESFEDNTVELTLTWLMRADGTQLSSGNGILADIVNTTSLVGITANLVGATNQTVQPAPAVRNEKGQSISSMAMRGGWVGQPLAGTNKGMGIAPATMGDVEWLKLIAAGFQDPCLTRTAFPTQLSNRGVPTASVSANVRRAETLPPETGSTNYADRDNAIYTYYDVVSSYIHDEGVDVAASMKAGTAGKKFRLAGESLRLEVTFWGLHRRHAVPGITVPSRRRRQFQTCHQRGRSVQGARSVQGEHHFPGAAISGLVGGKRSAACGGPDE